MNSKPVPSRRSEEGSGVGEVVVPCNDQDPELPVAPPLMGSPSGSQVRVFGLHFRRNSPEDEPLIVFIVEELIPKKRAISVSSVGVAGTPDVMMMPHDVIWPCAFVLIAMTESAAVS